MTDKTQKICSGLSPEYKVVLAAVLRELISQCSTSTPPDPNMDEFYARMYGSSDSVIYVDDIETIITELENDG